MKNFFLFFLLFVTPVYADKPVPVIDIPYYPYVGQYRPGWEERGEQWAKWLSPSVMVTESGGGGSGTICHYDGEYAYIISCGHLYPNGRKSWQEYKIRPRYKNITVFYDNGKQLTEYKKFKAETLCHVWNVPHDVSLLRFKPDWNPWISPIAPVDYKLEKGKFYHSTGCDGLTPTAHYLVRYQYENFDGNVSEIITTSENGPRGGRSGGGVMTDDGQLIFICSRGSSQNAYWTSLSQIHNFLKEEGFSFVLENNQIARELPIVDKIGPPKQYPKDFIPLPLGR